MDEKTRKELEKYEAETVVTKDGLTIADLKKVFNTVCNDDDWKAPWSAFVPHNLVSVVIEAAKFFHADVPEIGGIQAITGKVLVSGHGYQAW